MSDFAAGRKISFTKLNNKKLTPPFYILLPVCVFAAALTTSYALSKLFSIEPITRKYEAIDGLRGILGISVYISHSSVWFAYLKTGEWSRPASNFYAELGEASVSFFFMITSFLFVNKLMHGKREKPAWPNFYLSRFLRIGPMYYASLCLIIILIFASSNWSLQESLPSLIRSLAKWLIFTILGPAEINNYSETMIVNAGVIWTISYECLFYLILPAVASLFFRYKTDTATWLCSIIATLLILTGRFDWRYVQMFIGGVLAATFKYYFIKHSLHKRPIIDLLVLSCFLVILNLQSAFSSIGLIFVSVAFTLISLGSDIFGILSNRYLKFLGDISYSTYLLHGIIMYVTFYWMIGFQDAKLLSPESFSAIIILLAIILTIVSYLGFRYIEQPFMNRYKLLRNKITT